MIIKISGFAIIITIIIILLKQANNKSFAIILTLISTCFIFYIILPELNKIFLLLNNLSQQISLNQNYFSILLKSIGISYISELASQICLDSGEKAIATKISISSKIIILSLSIPILTQLIQTILFLI